MMQESRWTAEIAIMNKYFPQFAAFRTENGGVGFFGRVRGPRTGREYGILAMVPAQRYPETEPAVYIQPAHHERVLADGRSEPRSNGRLSVLHLRPWVPQRSTFANCVLVAIEFLEGFDQ